MKKDHLPGTIFFSTDKGVSSSSNNNKSNQ